jgi:hypothetical protein
LAHEHLELLEADFVQYYQRDLVIEMEAHPVRAITLMRQLPPESRLLRNFTGGLTWGWPEELLATNAEMLHAIAGILIKANSKKKVKVKEWHVPRPWEEQATARRVTSPREMVAVLGPMLGRGSYG